MPVTMSVPVVLVCQGINHALRRSGVTCKKNAHASKDVRGRVFQTMKMHEHRGRPLVYIDESGFVHDTNFLKIGIRPSFVRAEQILSHCYFAALEVW